MYDHIKIPQEDQKLRIARGSKLKKELRFIGTNTVQILQILTHYVNYLCFGPSVFRQAGTEDNMPLLPSVCNAHEVSGWEELGSAALNTPKEADVYSSAKGRAAWTGASL